MWCCVILNKWQCYLCDIKTTTFFGILDYTYNKGILLLRYKYYFYRLTINLYVFITALTTTSAWNCYISMDTVGWIHNIILKFSSCDFVCSLRVRGISVRAIAWTDGKSWWSWVIGFLCELTWHQQAIPTVVNIWVYDSSGYIIVPKKVYF